MAGVVDEIKERISIVDVVGQRVNLKKSGRSLKALCPFHNEKTPSFYVFPESGTFKCFGCGAGGDVFTFLMRSDNLEFGEVMRTLAERAGVDLRPAPEAAAEEQARAHARAVLDAAVAYFHNLLLRSAQAAPARAYLEKRGVTAASIEGWNLGYALESWDALQTYLATRGYGPADLLSAGLIVERESGGYYDRFRNRILFPIHDARGAITGFGARALGDDKPKYLNSPQSILFDKSATLYGIEHAREGIRQSGQVVIVEGYMDVLIPHQLGITNIVASLGTALTPKHMDPLKRLAKSIVLALDADAAGDEATLRGLEVARDVIDREAVPVPTWRGLIRFDHVLDTELRVLGLPRGKDPDEVVLENPDAWRQLVADSLPVVDFYFQAVTARLDMRNARDKSTAADRLLPIVAEILDDVVRSHYLQRLASLVQVDERVLTNRLRSLKQPAARRPAAAPPEPSPRQRPQRSTLDDYYLALLIYEPTLFWKTPELGLSADDFAGTENRLIYVALADYLQASESFDVAAFRGVVDSALHAHLDRLLLLPTQQPQGTGDELVNAFVVAVLRGRRQQLNSELARLTFLLREAREDNDPAELLALSSRVHTLSEDLGRLGRQLDERTVLWRTRGN